MKTSCFFASGILLGAFLVHTFKSTETTVEDRGIYFRNVQIAKKGYVAYYGTVTKWGQDVVETKAYVYEMNLFLNAARSALKINFPNLDTGDYTLFSYKKLEELTHFKETLIFASTDNSQLQFDITYDYNENREIFKCRTNVRIRRRSPFYSVIILPVIIIACYFALNYINSKLN